MKSKKILGLTRSFLIGFAVLFSTVAYGQEMSADGAATSLYQPGTWNFGAKGGVTLGYFGDNQIRYGEGAKKGLAGGGYAQYNHKTWFSLRAEVMYQQVGSANIDSLYSPFPTASRGTGVYTSSNITIHQLEVPFQAVVRPPVNWKLVPNLYAGYSIAYNFYATDERIETYESNPLGIENTRSFVRLYNNSEDFEELEHAVNMGMGFTYPIPDKSFNIVFDFRYRLGLSQLGQNRRLTDEGGRPVTDLNSDTFFFMLGIEF